MPMAQATNHAMAPTHSSQSPWLYCAPRAVAKGNGSTTSSPTTSETESDMSCQVPMLNIFNGGAHAAGSTEFQEFMVMPAGVESLSEALRSGSEIYQELGKLLQAEGLSTSVGFEGGYAPVGLTNRQALGYVTHAIESAGYMPGEEIFIALDPAASEFYVPEVRRYSMKREGLRLTAEMMAEEYDAFCAEYPICSIEDGLAENDWEGWQILTKTIGDKVQLVGDDLFVTQTAFLERGNRRKSRQRYPHQTEPSRHRNRDSRHHSAREGSEFRSCRQSSLGRNRRHHNRRHRRRIRVRSN